MKQRVLIVDDDVDHAESLADVLEMRGHPVELAHSGEAALETFRAGEFDLVLLDVKLPGMNGVETFLELKKIRPAARVMMMTGFSLEQLIAQAIENGALGVLYKPFAATDLLATLGQVTPRGLVLVADDDPDFVESIMPILAAADFDLRLAANGREAVAEIDKRMPDCLILDLGLAVLAGPDGMARLLDVCKSIPTILVTGGYSDEVAESVAGFGLRAHGLLQKPFDPRTLLAAVGAAVVPAAGYEAARAMIEAGALRRSVLIIDDDGDFAESLAELIEPQGYRVAIATDADEALARVDRASPDFNDAPVVFVDVRLGVTSGVDVLARLRAERSDLICVVMTAELDTQTAIAALRRGAYDYFDKSCDPGTLLAVLDRCFDLVKLQHERQAAYDALRLAKEEAEAASRAKSGFLATVSHELRTPLNAIIGFSEMMLREVLGALGNEHYRTYAGDIHASGTHLLQIINDILDLSKAESGKLELYEDVFDLRDMIRAVSQLTSTRIRDAGLSNATHLPCDLPLLRADERKTKQVLLNLVTNAAKFTPNGGHIEIVGEYDDEAGLALTVVDTGIGIAPDDLGRVLEPFVQVDSSLSRQHQGTGLGLPLVKAIMELHGGSVRLDSAVGIGTRVKITFPPDRAVFDAALRQPLNAA